MARRDIGEVPTIEDRARRRDPHESWLWSTGRRSSDAVANALTDIRELVEDLRDRVDDLERVTNDDEGLEADIRDITNRLDSLESEVGL